VIRQVLIWLRLERLVIEWIALIALALAVLIAYNIVLATQSHHVLNVYLQYEEKFGVREFRHGIRDLPARR
jgi:hypothetical protein